MAVGIGVGIGSGAGEGVGIAASTGVGDGVVAGALVEAGTGEGLEGGIALWLINVGGGKISPKDGSASKRAVAARFPISGARTIISSPLGLNSGTTGWETVVPAIPAWLLSAGMTGPSG